MAQEKETATAKVAISKEKNSGIATDIQVSESTAKYVRLLNKFEKIWSEIYDTLEIDYPLTGIDKVFGEEFEPHLLEVKKALEVHLYNSISENLNITGNNGKII